MNPVNRLLLTPGEPAGIGPELSVALAQKACEHELTAVADPALLHDCSRQLGLKLKIREIDPLAPPIPTRAGELACIPITLQRAAVPGKLDPANATYVIDTLKCANDLCMQGRAAGIVTGPVQKSVINEAGIAFSGHTEFFADNSHTKKVVMMLATSALRVALVTTHLPLNKVSSAITKTELEQTIRILHDALQRQFKLQQPKILICGLNPHAGENGHLGMEEIEVINPVIRALQQEGMDLIGPLPADTLYTKARLADADATLAMYHDQGLPVLKYSGFGDAVNITLGLPYVRTSVDHGTALDLAGQGIASVGSMQLALQQAIALCRHATH